MKHIAFAGLLGVCSAFPLSAQIGPLPPLIAAPPPFAMPRLGTASGPGAGSALILTDATGSRVENPARLASGARWAVIGGFSEAPDVDAREYRLEASARFDLIGIGVSGRRREMDAAFPTPLFLDDALRDDALQLGAALRSRDGRVAVGANVGAHRSDNLGLRGEGHSWSAAVAVRPVSRLRLSVLTLDRAVETDWSGGIGTLEGCPAGLICTEILYEFTSPAQRVLAVGGELLPVELGRVTLAGGAEYSRIASGPVRDAEWRCGLAVGGLGPAGLRITAERLNEGYRRGWIISAGFTVASSGFVLGAGNRFARSPEYSVLGDVRTVSGGYFGR